MAGRHSRMLATAATSTTLLDLPDPCLLAVLQYSAADPATLFSAARAHSRLHQAAVQALSRIEMQTATQQQVTSLLLYTDRHGQHVSSISLGGEPEGRPELKGLPVTIQLHTLQLSNLRLRLPPFGTLQGELSQHGPAGSSPLTQLQLSNCTLHGSLATALSQLPGLQHVSVSGVLSGVGGWLCFPNTVFQQLQQLTHLKLDGVSVLGPAGGPGQQQGLSRLVELQLRPDGYLTNTNWLSGCSALTRLVLSGRCLVLHPAILAGHTQLQHLQAPQCSMHGGPAGIPRLLSELQNLQQLTYLSLASMQPFSAAASPPAAAYAALTASSRLQHLDISGCTVPAGVWQHVFPPGRQLPHLTFLDLHGVVEASRGFAAAPSGALLLSCCPGLQYLNMLNLPCGAEQLGPLSGLSSLSSLSADVAAASPAASWEAVAQLTGLRQLKVCQKRVPEGLLLQLSCLKQLTCLEVEGLVDGKWRKLQRQDSGRGGERVWRQVLRYHQHHSTPEVAQQAAAALAE